MRSDCLVTKVLDRQRCGPRRFGIRATGIKYRPSSSRKQTSYIAVGNAIGASGQRRRRRRAGSRCSNRGIRQSTCKRFTVTRHTTVLRGHYPQIPTSTCSSRVVSLGVREYDRLNSAKRRLCPPETTRLSRTSDS